MRFAKYEYETLNGFEELPPPVAANQPKVEDMAPSVAFQSDFEPIPIVHADRKLPTAAPKASPKKAAEQNDIEDAPPPPAHVMITKEELAQQIDAARAAGKAEAADAAKASHEQAIKALQDSQDARLTQVLQQMSTQLTNMQAKQSQISETLLANVVRLSLALTQKVVSGLDEEQVARSVEAMAGECLSLLYGEAVVTIEVHEDLVPAITERLATLKQQSGFNGELEVKAAAHIVNPLDCQVVWQHGVAVQETGQLWAEIKNIINRFENSQLTISENKSAMEESLNDTEISLEQSDASMQNSSPDGKAKSPGEADRSPAPSEQGGVDDE